MINNIYLALLRGINVGGNNIIKMTSLKECFESMEFSNVSTYIQSGNVLFQSDVKDKLKLTNLIEKELSDKFSYSSRIVLITMKQLESVVKEAPEGFGTLPEEFRYDVLFVKEPLTANEALESVKTRDGVDSAHAGKDVLYFSRLISKAGQSYMSKIITLPIYKNMTIRNWNTTTKLLEKMQRG